MLQKNNKNSKQQKNLSNRHILHTLSISIGTLSSLMGIGGGTMTVPLLKKWGFTMKIATGTSSLLTSVIATSGTICFIIAGWHATSLTHHYIGYVNWLALICIVPTIMLGAPLGAYISRHLNDTTLSRIFALFLIINAIKMLAVLMK